jgi:hypothetical protein
MKKVLLVFILFLSLFSQAQHYYITTADKRLFKVDLSICNFTLIGYTDSAMTDIAICSDYKLYGIDGRYLYEIDTLTAQQILISPIDTPIFFNNLVCDNGGYLLALGANDSLYYINRFTGASNVLGNIGYSYNSAGDLTFYRDTLYLSADSNRLVKIILPSVTTQLIGVMNSTYIFGLNSICHDFNEVMIASGGTVSPNNSNLYSVNPLNGNLILLCDSIVDNLIWGAASLLEPYNPDLGCGFFTNMIAFQNSSSLYISPCPAYPTSDITFNYTQSENGTHIIINDINGKEIIRYRLPQWSTTQTVKLPNISAGVYIARLISNEQFQISNVKFVVE